MLDWEHVYFDTNRARSIEGNVYGLYCTKNMTQSSANAPGSRKAAVGCSEIYPEVLHYKKMHRPFHNKAPEKRADSSDRKAHENHVYTHGGTHRNPSIATHAADVMPPSNKDHCRLAPVLCCHQTTNSALSTKTDP